MLLFVCMAVGNFFALMSTLVNKRIYRRHALNRTLDDEPAVEAK